MGSISSRPKVPATSSQVVYVPVYQQTSTPTSATSAGSVTGQSETATDAAGEAEKKSQERAENLLKRDRSRFGTVLTGFRGLLASASGEASPQRKTLLGE